MAPPPPPVEQEAADGQQDQDDAGHQQAEGKPGELRVRGSLLLPLMACVSQRNGIKAGRGPVPLACLSFQLRGAPPIPGAPSALRLPGGRHVSPGVPSGRTWLCREGRGAAEASWRPRRGPETAEALRGPRRGPGSAWLLGVSGRGRWMVCLLRCVTLGRASGSRRAHLGRGDASHVLGLLAPGCVGQWRRC